MSQPWKVRIGDDDVEEASITTGEAVDIARLAGAGWDALDPLAGPSSLSAIVSVLRATRLGDDLDEALGKVRETPVADLLALLSVEQATPAE